MSFFISILVFAIILVGIAIYGLFQAERTGFRILLGIVLVGGTTLLIASLYFGRIAWGLSKMIGGFAKVTEYQNGQLPKEIVLSPDIPDSLRLDIVGNTVHNKRPVTFIAGRPNYFSSPDTVRMWYLYKFIDTILYDASWDKGDTDRCMDSDYNVTSCEPIHYAPGTRFWVRSQFMVRQRNSDYEQYLVLEDSRGNLAEIRYPHFHRCFLEPISAGERDMYLLDELKKDTSSTDSVLLVQTSYEQNRNIGRRYRPQSELVYLTSTVRHPYKGLPKTEFPYYPLFDSKASAWIEPAQGRFYDCPDSITYRHKPCTTLPIEPNTTFTVVKALKVRLNRRKPHARDKCFVATIYVLKDNYGRVAQISSGDLLKHLQQITTN